MRLQPADSPLASAAVDMIVFGRLTLRRGPGEALRRVREIRAVRSSPLFSAEHYVGQRSDLAALPDPARHYVLYGAGEGLDPGLEFNTLAYLALNPDVAASGVNPLAHYERAGRQEGRSTSGEPSTAGPLRGWPLAHAASPSAELPLQARRPDDPVLEEAAAGESFLSHHRLLSEAPDFAAAVAALNAKPRSRALSGEGAEPGASIVIPVHGHLAYTLNALDSLISHHSRHSFEIVVVDDASPDESARYLAQVNGIRLIRQPENQGFLFSANAGAEQAQGRHIVMLNNDVRVVEGWLDALINGFFRFPVAGLVGSKLFNPDATLQEAGGIIWKDASAWNYGRGEDPNRPAYCYARQVDYVSGCALALPTAAWRELGGFDPAFAPAYCEDSDLAFRVRASGRQVWMQPLSRVIHYEGKSSGRDLTSGPKAFQLVNQEKLLRRWKPVLASHRSNGDRPEFERERGVERRVLVLDATTPSPTADAGSVTTTKIIGLFQQLGYKVTFAPVDNLLFERDLTPALQGSGVECLYAPYVSDLGQHLAAFGRVYDVIHVFRYSVLDKVLPLLKRHCPRVKIVFNNMDLHYLRVERQAETEQSSERREQARAMKAAELKVMAAADVICVPSLTEEALLKEALPGCRVALMPYIVDESRPVNRSTPPRDVMFLGGFRHTPNLDAIEWFARAVWPLVARRVKDARFVIVGAHPTPAIQALARQPNIAVTGRVEDLEPWFARTRVFVAPMRYGAGVKGKIYSALAHGTPVVSTPMGAEGMGLEAGVDVLEAETPEGFAEAVVRLYEDDALWAALSEAGPKRMARYHGMAAGEAALRTILRSVDAPA